MTEIPKADYYTTDDGPERLSDTTPEEALEAWLDDLHDPRDPHPAADDVRAHAPVALHCWRRETVPEAFAVGLAHDAVERAAESYGEDYGDMEESTEFPPDRYAAAVAAVAAALRDLFDSVDVWRCEQFASVELPADDVLEMLDMPGVGSPPPEVDRG